MVPADVGFTATYNWTAKIVKEYIQKTFNVNYSISGVTTLLHRLGFSYTRPSYTLKKADPEKQEQFKKEFNDLKKKLIDDEFARILFEDESMIRDYQAICRTWFLTGKQRLIPTY